MGIREPPSEFHYIIKSYILQKRIAAYRLDQNLFGEFRMILLMRVTFSIMSIISTVIIITFLLYEGDSNIYALSDRSKFEIGSQLSISNNTEGDSVYAQVAASGNNIYVVWQDTQGSDTASSNKPSSSAFDSLYSQNKNYDIYFRKSIDRGVTFGKDINLSNNSGFSEHPQIAVIENHMYIVWVDDTYGNKEISFIKSTDAGTTFNKPIKISNNTSGHSQNAEIAAFGDAVYIVWEDSRSGYNDDSGVDGANTNLQNRILLRASQDRGNTLENMKIINNSTVESDSRPKVAAFGENSYITWNVGTPKDTNTKNGDSSSTGVFTVRSTDGGKTFSRPYKISESNQPVGETQVASARNNVYVVWAGDPDKRIESDMFFSRSFDAGETFDQAAIIPSNNNTITALTAKDGTSLNAEIAARGSDIYIPWQNKANEADRNEEILLIRSTDEGSTFNTPLIPNLSNNDGISECPSIAISGNNIYIVWEDDTTGNHEIFFKRNLLV